MTSYKHLTLDDRTLIQQGIVSKKSLKEIARELSVSNITLSREIKKHLVFERTGCVGFLYNACKHRFKCDMSHICNECHAVRRYRLCKSCGMCNSFCKDFEADICSRLSKPPYVCNACGNRTNCTLEKRFYRAKYADQEYREVYSESRKGFSLSELELKYLDETITPLLKNSQSPHHICRTNPDTIMISESTVYRLINSGALSAIRMDLPRAVRFKPRTVKIHKKVDKKCRVGRTYADFTLFMENDPNTAIVEIDSVEGKKGGKVLLTIHFVKAECMLAFLRDHNDSKSVIDVFNDLYDVLGKDMFKKMFPVLLGDNGSEFSNPTALEFDESGERRTKVFYCDPSAPYQKGSAEVNHEFIRRIIPKGEDFSEYSQEDIDLMMDHINSYSRNSLGWKSPYEMMCFMYGEEFMDLLECHLIPPQKVTLNKSIFNKEV